MNRIKKIFAVAMGIVLMISMLTPGTVMAASKPKLSMSSKTLYVNGSKVKPSLKSTYTVKVKNKPKKYSASWKVDDKSVATVTKKAGGKAVIKAVGVGTTTVTATIKDKTAKVTYKLPIKVTVKKNCSAVMIYKPKDLDLNVPLKVDDVIELTGKMFNESATEVNTGKEVTDIIFWASSDESVATVKDGVVKAVGVGTADITCYSAQDKTGIYSKLEHATAKKSITISVKQDSLVSVSQKKLNVIEAVFADNMSEKLKKEDIVLSSATNVKPEISEITFDASGKIVEIRTAGDLMEGVKYTVKYQEVSKEIVATKGKPARLEIYTGVRENMAVVPANGGAVGTELKFRLYNSSGVDITPDENTAAYKDAEARVEYSLPVGMGYISDWHISGNKIYFYAPDKTATINAIYHTFEYVNGSEAGNLTASARITSIKESRTIIPDGATVLKYTMSGEKHDWTDNKFILSVSDADRRIVVRAKNSKGEYIYSDSLSGRITFEANVSNVLIVNPDGMLIPIAPGNEMVRVLFDNDVIGTYNVSVIDARKVQRIEILDQDKPLSSSVMLSSMYGMGNLTLTVKVYDQLNDLMPITGSGSIGLADNIIIESMNNNTGAPLALLYANADGTGRIEIDASGFGDTAGRNYAYKVSCDNFASGFSITVINPNPMLTSTYALDIMGDTDISITDKSTKLPALSLSLYEMKGNLKYSKIERILPESLAYSEGDYFYRISYNGKTVTKGNAVNTIYLAEEDKGILSKYATGVYKIDVFQKVGLGMRAMASRTITLTDSQKDVSVELKKPNEAPKSKQKLYSGMSDSEMVSAFLECFEVKIGDRLVFSGISFEKNDVAHKCYVSAGSLVIRRMYIDDEVTIDGKIYKVRYTYDLNRQIKN